MSEAFTAAPEPGAYVRLFLAEGEPMQALLKNTQRDGAGGGHAARVLAHHERSAPNHMLAVPSYVCPGVGTFADDGDNPLDACEESIPGEIRLAEGFSLADLPDPCRLESSRKRKRGDEPSGGAS